MSLKLSHSTSFNRKPLVARETTSDGNLEGRSEERFWNRITPTELRRRLWHMLPGLLPVLLWFFPHRDPLSPTLQVIIVAVIGLLAAGIVRGYRRIARGDVYQCAACVLGYSGSVLGMVLLFPGQLELGLTVLAILAFGDGSATLGGILLRGPKLPWNRNKSWAGFACFLLFGIPAAMIVYWGETAFNPESLGPPISLGTAFVCAAIPTVAAAIAESRNSRIDDNVRVGVTAAAAICVTHGFLVGWAY
jgi:dolichol kinase